MKKNESMGVSRMPYYPPAYGYAPHYGYAPVVAAPATPPVYIQQQEIVQVAPQAWADNYWHYCRNPEDYYLRFKNCPDGWMQGSFQPPAK